MHIRRFYFMGHRFKYVIISKEYFEVINVSTAFKQFFKVIILAIFWRKNANFFVTFARFLNLQKLLRTITLVLWRVWWLQPTAPFLGQPKVTKRYVIYNIHHSSSFVRVVWVWEVKLLLCGASVKLHDSYKKSDKIGPLCLYVGMWIRVRIFLLILPKFCKNLMLILRFLADFLFFMLICSNFWGRTYIMTS